MALWVESLVSNVIVITEGEAMTPHDSIRRILIIGGLDLN